jgi:hypothetical protein
MPAQTLHELLTSEHFRRRPAMWIGKLSIIELRSFIDGYLLAIRNYEIEEEINIFSIDFHDFVADYYKKPSAAGWALNIWADNYGNAEQCFKDFFMLYDRFTKNKKSHDFYTNLLLLYRGQLKQEDVTFE